MTDCVTPPAQGEWYDLAEIVDTVLERLRLQRVDGDRGRIETLVPVAAEQINIRLDRAYPMTAIDANDGEEDPQPLATNVTPALLDALVNVTVELYLRRGPVPKDVFSVGDVAAAIDVAAPGIEEGHKSRWGIA